MEFLLAHSFISFVFLEEEDITYEHLQRFTSARGKPFFLIHSCTPSKGEELKRLVPNGAVIELSKKEPAAVVKSIRARIKGSLSKEKSPLCQLSQCLSFHEFGITVDEEENIACCQGKKLAEEIKQSLVGIAPFKVKEKLVPLQGPTLWHKWASYDKTQNCMRLEDTDSTKINDFKQKHFRWKKNIRKEQSEKAT